MIDTYGRQIDYLRISVTDRCNLRCRYCMPAEGIEDQGHKQILSLEQIYRIIKAAGRSGISKVRITGGEPLVRKNITGFIKEISGLPEIEDISMTSNGILFLDMADELKQAGLNRVNLSLDTLENRKYRYITRKGDVEQAWRSVLKALELGMHPVKINVVVIKGFNDDEILDFATLAYEFPLHIRFIEFMPIGDLDFHTEDKVLSMEAVKNIVAQKYQMTNDIKVKGYGPAKYVRLRGGRGSLGFISPLSDHFCSECNRIRLTADGKLRGCLYNKSEIDLRLALYNNCSDEQLLTLFRKAIMMKPGQHHMLEGWGKDNPRKMYQIGG